MHGDFYVEENYIRTIKEPLLCFAEEPLLIMRSVDLAAKLGIELHETIKDAVKLKNELLKTVGTDGIRLEFEKIMTAEFAGHGLKILEEAGLLFHIIGNLAERMPKGTKEQLTGLIKNIDKTKPIKERRLGLFYLCFDKRRVFEGIRLLNYDAKTRELIAAALKNLDAMDFLVDSRELKLFAARLGREKYEYLDGLAKARRIVYELPETAILNRHYMMQRIKNNNEPLFVEDLDIDFDDLLENDIAAGDKADRIMEALLKLVHKKPELNKKKVLLFYARRYAKNPLMPIYQRAMGFLRQ